LSTAKTKLQSNTGEKHIKAGEVKNRKQDEEK
jgi:hypothetical protein